MSGVAKFVKSLAEGRQRLYHCSRSIKNYEGESSEYIVMSNSMGSRYTEPETMCFLATSNGDIKSYSEVHHAFPHNADKNIFEELDIEIVS